MKVLVASSGRPDEFDPIELVITFPWPQGSEFHILSAVETPQPVMIGMGPEVTDRAGEQRAFHERAQSVATETARRLRERGLQAEGFAREGPPEAVITDHAKTWGSDLIVVGSHDRPMLERLLLGSVSTGVVKHAPCSVLVVKHGSAG